MVEFFKSLKSILNDRSNVIIVVSTILYISFNVLFTNRWEDGDVSILDSAILDSYAIPWVAMAGIGLLLKNNVESRVLGVVLLYISLWKLVWIISSTRFVVIQIFDKLNT